MGIQGSSIQKSFGSPPTPVLKGIDLDIQDGEFVALTGRSGSGKSTLLYVLSSLDTPSSGKLIIDDKDVEAMDVKALHRFRNRYMGFVFQFHYLLPELTALENVLMPTMKNHESSARAESAKALLEEFGLKDKSNRFPGQLSGGEQQRVAIARALIMEPRYLFADEPTGNLDSVNGDIVIQLLQRLNRERGTTIIYVTHDPDYAKLASRIIEMVDGRIK